MPNNYALRSYNNRQKIKRESNLQRIEKSLKAILDGQDPVSRRRVYNALASQELTYALHPESTIDHPRYTKVFNDAKKRVGMVATTLTRDRVQILDPDNAQTIPDAPNGMYYYWVRMSVKEMHAIILEAKGMS